MQRMFSLLAGWILMSLPLTCQAQANEPESDSSSETAPTVAAGAREEGSHAGAFAESSDYFMNRFSPLDPVYIAFGWRGGFHAKFQLSFKYRIIKEKGWPARQIGLLDDIYFGYSQFSLWDLGRDSAPFRDINYKPSFFYEADYWENQSDWLDLGGLRAGFEHESNGRDRMDSRSLNILYIRPRLVLGNAQKFYFEIAPKAYVYVGDLSDNPDIEDYRGYVDLNLRMGYGNGWQIASTLRRGTKKDYGSVQVDATYPLRRIFFIDDLGGFLHLQYFNGWGETLLSYREKNDAQFRVGIMILR